MGKKHPQVTNITEAEERTVAKGNKFGFTGKRLGPTSGARQLGCSWYEVPPGKTSFPHHYHCANEEGVYILEGTGEARLGDDTVEVGPGDYIAYPAGPEYAHTLKNSGSTPLRYLCISTLLTTEIVGYPDSKKIAGASGVDPVKGFAGAKIKFIIKEQPSVDYYEGEDV